MPKLPKAFQRRKSTANALDDLENLPSAAEHSFKVFERSGGGSTSFDGGVKLGKTRPGRPLTSPKQKEDNIFEDIKGNRGSGASNTNTISTTDNSSRLSAASTAASSTNEQHPTEEWRSPHDKPFHDIPMPPIPKSSSGFSLKQAGRTLSWGRNKPAPTPPTTKPVDRVLDKSPMESPAIEEDRPQYGRDRAVTVSSYASTATPPKFDEKDLDLSLGGDFTDMFSGFAKRKSAVSDAQNMREMSNGPEYTPPAPAARSYSSSRLNQPPPLNIDRNRQIEPSPYSWSSQHSHDGLISNPSPSPSAPPPVPQHGSPARDTLPSTARPQRPGVADSGLRRSSAISAKRQSTLEYGDGDDEDAKLLREAVNATRRMQDPYSNDRSRDSWALPSSSTQYNPQPAANSNWVAGSEEATPRAKKMQPEVHDENMFDPDIMEDASAALAFNEQPLSQPTQPQIPQNKVMTPQQFERYKQDLERLRSVGGLSRDDEEEEEHYDDEEDDAEKRRQIAKQRRKQEAHMSVYRQQMMKVTGESSSAPRPGLSTSQSSPNLLLNGQAEEAEEEDEEVPLAILQAHGFPNKNRPPAQLSSVGSNPNLRAAAQMGGGGNLPVFARNLPQDPYVGAGLVNPSQRESLAFGAGSVNGGSSRGVPPPGGMPGGLVGVIATEERSRAMRRGSPNPDGQYAPMPSNLMNGMPMGRNLGGIMSGMGPMGQMGPMMLTPGDQAQIEMTHQMQQFMQMQMQFMQMMTAGQGQPQQNGHLSQPPVIPRPGSAQGHSSQNLLRPDSSHQRTMSMMDSKPVPWMQGGPMFAPSTYGQGGGYSPSIAPSERSNVGLPGRYRPVSHMPAADKSRASTMPGALQDWESKTGTSTIKAVKKTTNVSDDEDEEGWAEMKKKREKKKSLWKTKKEDPNGLKEMLSYAGQ